MKNYSCPYCGEQELKQINRCTDGTILFECKVCNEILTDEEVTEVHRGPKKFKKKQEEVE